MYCECSRRSLPTVLTIVALHVFAGLAEAQAPAATLTGRIQDQTGALLPNAAVTLVDVDRNVAQVTRSGEFGGFVFPLLRPARYSVSAELAGFRRFAQDGIVVQVGQVVRMDIRLAVGPLEETVQVQGVTPLLETETSSRGRVIDQEKILDLPLDGRDYNQLALLSPGVLPPTPRLTAVNFKGVMNVNGNRAFNNAFLLDGVNNVSYSTSYRGENAQAVQPSVEALQEFRVATSGYSVEFGNAPGAVVTAAVRSGANDVRGSVYEFLRNDALDANNFFSKAFGGKKPIRQRNQFGGAFGGPLVQARVFWFGAYEGLREREGVPQSRTVPTAQEKAGVFSTPVVDPFLFGRPEFGRNGTGQWVIPPERWDLVAARIVALIPDPNVPGTNIYASTPVVQTRADQFHVRIDQEINPSSRLFGRYSFADSRVVRPAPLPGLAEGSYSDAFGTSKNRSQGVAIGLTYAFSSSLTGDFRLGWTGGDYSVAPPNAGVDGPKLVGLQNVPSTPEVVGGLPKIGLQGYDAIGRHTSTPQFQNPRTWNPRATFSWNHRNHIVKFGAEFLQIRTRVADVTAPIGAMGFANLFSGRAVGDLLLGLPSALALTSYSVLDQSQSVYAGFVQDDFKVVQSLTLNFGLRYEYGTPTVERDNRLANFDAVTGAVLLAKEGNAYERSLVRQDRNDWAPRVGFSLVPSPGWAARGAYGVFYSHTVRQGREGMLGFNPPHIVDNLIISPVFGPLAVASAAVFRMSNGYPQGLLDPARLSPFVYRRAQDAHQRSPYVQQFSLGIQRALTTNMLLDVGYVGNKGTKLPGFRNLNAPAVVTNANGSQSAGARPYPTFGDIQFMENRVSSNYHSLQIGLDKRFSAGLSALVSYTWGKALAGGADHLSTSLVGPGVDTGMYNVPQNPRELKADYGPAEFDVTHRFVASYIYELPWGRARRWGQSWPSAANLFLGNWQVSGIHVFQGGLPLTATLSGASVLNLGSDRVGRPNLVADPELPVSARSVERWFNTDAFVIPGPAPQAFGNSGVGVMRGPGLVNFDFSIAKKIPVDETRYFQFRTELFNAFNHPAFAPPDIRRESSTFGRILSAGNARIIQFGLKLYY